MNTNDFYKQLMSEYTFDHEKIKKAAMGKIAEKKKVKFPIKWASVTAAAAVAVTVGVGVIATTGGNPVSVAPSSVSTQERFRLSLEAYEKADANTQEVYLYVTFLHSVTPSDMQSILANASGTGTIKVVAVYTNDNQVISGSADIQALFENEKENIAAVKIKCPGNLFKVISNDKAVYLVEPSDLFESNDFSVIDTESEYPDYPFTTDKEWETTPPVTTQPEPVLGDSTPVREETEKQTEESTPAVVTPVPSETEQSQTAVSSETAITPAESTPQQTEAAVSVHSTEQPVSPSESR